MRCPAHRCSFQPGRQYQSQRQPRIPHSDVQHRRQHRRQYQRYAITNADAYASIDTSTDANMYTRVSAGTSASVYTNADASTDANILAGACAGAAVANTRPAGVR